MNAELLEELRQLVLQADYDTLLKTRDYLKRMIHAQNHGVRMEARDTDPQERSVFRFRKVRALGDSK